MDAPASTTPVTIESIYGNCDISNIMLSPSGLISCIYSKYARLFFPRLVSTHLLIRIVKADWYHSSTVYITLDVPENITAVHACNFGNDGRTLFLFMRGPSTNYVYRFAIDQANSSISDTFTYLSELVSYPLLDQSKCIYR